MFNLVCKPDEAHASYIASEGIDWKFLPPRAPNFGGLWEAGVKSFKFYLKKVVGNIRLTYEEFLTVIIQIEGMLNSRPLVPLSSDLDDLNVLTPSHFLIGRSITSIVEPDLTNLNENRLDNWQKITKIIQLIWKRWSVDYLNSLQQRNKWHFEKKNAKIGDMVIIKEDNLPSCQWSLGRINNIYPGKNSKEFYPYCIKDTDKSTPENIVPRINLEKEEAENFKNHYSVVSNTNWIVYACTPNPQRKIEELKELLFGLETANPTEEAEFEEDLYKCETRLDDLEETVQYNNNRYVVELPFRKHWNELSNNISVAKQRFQSLWGRLRRDKTLYTQYKETIQDYLNQGIIEKVNDTEINAHKPMYYLPHQAIKKEGRVTTSTRIVFDAASDQANELSLNDCLWPGPNLNPNLLDVLINFMLNRVAISSDIRQAFLQICLADKHKDFVRFLWTDSNPRIGEKLTLQVYRFNRVIFGVNSSPFLLAATIKYHIEKYNEIHPITVQHLNSFMYVDDWITGQDTPEEALFMSRHAKNIMKEAGMEMRKWISNDTVLMAQWAAEGFDTHPMDASIKLGTNKTKVLGMAWQTLDDCLTLDTKGLLEFVSINENTKRFMLQTIGKIFVPLGLLSPFTIRIKCVIQELWIKKVTWDEILPPKVKEKWLIWCKELPLLDNLRIPRLVLDSTNDEVSYLIEIHIFCDASKLAYGAAAYVKVRKQNEVLVNLITSKTRVAPLKAVTLPRLELLGALVAARLSSRVQEIVRKKKECKVFHWTDSKIVLFWIKGSSKRWKQFVANRVQEISELTDPDSWFHCSGQDNPSDFLSRGLSVDTLISNNKWWTGPAFLRTDELPKTVSECPELNEVDYLSELKSKDSKEHTVLTLNFNQTFFDHLLSRSNKFLTIVRVLSFLYRFLFNIRNPTNKKTGPLTSDEMKEAEIYLMKQVQLSSFYKEIRAMQNGDDICNKSANREIKALSKLVRDREESLFAFFAEEGIEWSFIPPRSPNWGGLWEANIKSLKYHFKRVAGNSKFSYEELLTLITQIEAILNSRPLTPLSSDVDNLEVLTLAHFLIGRPITAIVEPSLLQCESNRLNVWQRITKSVQTIWKRWSLSYLNSLQQRKKWIVNKENLKLGDMVLIREENLPPCKWLLGRVVKIYMGKDKKVRVVDIKTGKGIYKGSINRLSILPIEN
ncbi:integrase catalytic domain-containing protein [Trichonephila clavipes]|nr:integrase catalytic domain-containing protein [Trichonephila clavipes]